MEQIELMEQMEREGEIEDDSFNYSFHSNKQNHHSLNFFQQNQSAEMEAEFMRNPSSFSQSVASQESDGELNERQHHGENRTKEEEHLNPLDLNQKRQIELLKRVCFLVREVLFFLEIGH